MTKVIEVIHQRVYKRGSIDYDTRNGVTIVLATSGERWALGVSACDNKDSYNRKIGYRTALERAKIALSKGKIAMIPSGMSKKNIKALARALNRTDLYYREVIINHFIEELFTRVEEEKTKNEQ